MATHSTKIVVEDQMSTLHDMVLEMKKDLQITLEELAKIQDKEETEINHSKELQYQQQQQLEYLTETIHEIKNQLSCLTQNIVQVKNEQTTLKNQIEEVRYFKDSCQESKANSDKDRPDLLDDFSAASDRWKMKCSEVGADTNKHVCDNFVIYSIDDNITEVACKSLSLTQALSEECVKQNLPQTSDGEAEDQDRWKMSHHTSEMPHLVSGDQPTNRAHKASDFQDRSKDAYNAVQRQKAVAELADSERDYCSKLWSLIHTYLNPLETAGILNSRELDVIFPPYLDHLYSEHRFICAGLQERLIHWTYKETVADLLVTVTDSQNSESLLSLYKDYTDGLPAAVACLRKARAYSSDFQSFLKAIQQGSHQSEDLMSLLLAPVQRIPKYLLQLQKVLCHTPPTHTDFPLLQASLHWLQSFVDRLNEDMANILRVLSQDQLVGQASSMWSDSPSFGPYFRQQQRVPGYLSVSSQPNLTVYNLQNSLNPNPQTFAQVHCNQSFVQSALSDDSDDIEAKQLHKFKVKRSCQSPFSYSTTKQDVFFHSLPRQTRSSSAVDFRSHPHHIKNYRNPPVQPRNCQHQFPQPRPHTVLGTHAANPSYRPTIISRKQIRKSRSQISSFDRTASDILYPEPITSTVTSYKAGHHNAQVCDLPPLPPMLHRRANTRDDHEEDEEDDTVASDTHSFCTSGSHPHSISHISDDISDTGQDTFHFKNNANETAAHDSKTFSKSSSEEATAGVSVMFSSNKENMRGCQDMVTSQTNNGLFKPNSVPGVQLLPSELTVSQLSVSKQHRVLSVNKGAHKLTSSVHLTKPNYKTVENRDIKNGSLLPKDSCFSADGLATSTFSTIHRGLQENDTDLFFRGNVIIASVPEPTVDNIIDKTTEDEDAKFVSKSNRQQSLIIGSSVIKRMGQDDRFSNHKNSKTDTRSSAASLNESVCLCPSSDGDKDPSLDLKSDPCKVLPQPPPRTNRPGFPQLNQSSVQKVTLGTKSGTPSIRLSSQANNSEDVRCPASTYAQKSESNCNQKVSQNRVIYPESPPVSSNDSFNNSLNTSKITSTCSGNLYGKPHPVLISSTNSVDVTAPPCETMNDASQSAESGGHVRNSHHPSRSPDQHEHPLQNVRDEGRQREYTRIRSELNYNATDYLPTTNDNTVIKKKTPFKTSIKNLFAKKRGRVILANVEREVLLEMAAAAQIKEKTNSGSTDAFTNSANYLSRLLGSLRGFHTVAGTASHQILEQPQVRTLKDQASSTSSPVKVNRKFSSCTKHDKQTHCDIDDRYINSLQNSEQFSQQQNTHKHFSDCREPSIAETKDAELNYRLENDGDSPSVADEEKFIEKKMYTKENNNPFCSLQDQTKSVSEYKVLGGEESRLKLHEEPESGPDMRALCHHQSQTGQSDLSEIRISESDQTFSDGFKNVQHETVYKDSKDLITHRQNSESKNMPQTELDQQCEQCFLKMHQTVSDGPCEKCLKCEVGWKEKKESPEHVNKSNHGCYLKNYTVHACDKSLTSFPNQNFKVHERKQTSKVNLLSHMPAKQNVLLKVHNGDTKPSVTKKTEQSFPCITDSAAVYFTGSLMSWADTKHICEMSKGSKVSYHLR